MDLHIQLRTAVVILEIVLTFSLIMWMRSSVRGEAVSWRMIAKVLLFGALAALISAFVTIRYSFNIDVLQVQAPLLVDKYKGLMVFLNTLSAAMVEELAKYAIGVFLLITPTTQKHQRLSDTIVFMIMVGLGFSLIEDFLFLLNPVTVAPYRLLSFYLHSGTSAIIGYSLGRFRYGLTGYKEVLRAVCAAILLHAAYNLTTELDNQPLAIYLTFALTIFISLQIFILFRRTIVEQFTIEQKMTTTKQTPIKLLNLVPKYRKKNEAATVRPAGISS